MRCTAILLVTACCSPLLVAQDASEVDRGARTPLEAARDYVGSIYELAPARIRRSVSPELAKKGYFREELEQPYRAVPMTWERLVELAGTYNAEGRIPDDAPQEIEVLYARGRIAVVKLTAHWGIDYMQMERREDGRWMTRHILWQSHPPADYEATELDRIAVQHAALDYIQAFYERKPERIDQSVSSELVKFGFYGDWKAARGVSMTFAQLRELSLHAFRDGKPANAPEDVELLDILDQTACVRLRGAWGTDVVSLARDGEGQWKIEQVLWQSTPLDTEVPADGPGKAGKSNAPVEKSR